MKHWLLQPVIIKLVSFLVIVYLAEASRRAVRQATGPRERAFTIRAVIVSWLVMGTFIAASAALPVEWFWLPVALYLSVAPVAILAVRNVLTAIRAEEAKPERTGTEKIIPQSEPMSFA